MRFREWLLSEATWVVVPPDEKHPTGEVRMFFKTGRPPKIWTFSPEVARFPKKWAEWGQDALTNPTKLQKDIAELVRDGHAELMGDPSERGMDSLRLMPRKRFAGVEGANENI